MKHEFYWAGEHFHLQFPPNTILASCNYALMSCHVIIITASCHAIICRCKLHLYKVSRKYNKPIFELCNQVAINPTNQFKTKLSIDPNIDQPHHLLTQRSLDPIIN